MRRLVILLSAATVSLIGVVIATAGVASASTATTEPSTEPSSSAIDGHPILGTWTMTDTADPEHPFVASFSGVGNYVQVEDGEVALGVWEPTGPTSAAMTFTGQLPPQQVGEIAGATLTIRATIEVAPDGQSLTAEYTVEAGGMDWMPTGEHGPGQVTGARVAVEPMGTPVGSLEDFYALDEGSEGTEVVEGTALTEATEVAAPPTTSS